jgi:uncharacterized protein (DUF1499 family)
MTLEDFQNRFRRTNRFDRYWYHGLCLLYIAFSIYIIYEVVTNSKTEPYNKIWTPFLFSLFLFSLGTYGLYVLTNTYKLTFWNNSFKRHENVELLNQVCSELQMKIVTLNDNTVFLRYRTKWWKMSYDVHLFADDNLIVINVESVDTYNGGFIDFGASKRTQTKILNLIQEKYRDLKV